MDLFLFGIILLVVGIILMVPAILIRGKTVVVVGIAGVVILLVGIAFVAGVFGPAQIATTHNAPTVKIQDLKATTGYNTTVSASNPLELTTTVELNPALTGQSAIVYPASANVHFTFQLARTDTNTSAAEFQIFGGNQVATNSTASSSSTNIVYTTTSGVEYEDVDSANVSAASAHLVSIPGAGIITVYVNLTLSGQAMLNLWDSGTSATTVSGATFMTVSPFNVVSVDNQDIALGIQLVKS